MSGSELLQAGRQFFSPFDQSGAAFAAEMPATPFSPPELEPQSLQLPLAAAVPSALVPVHGIGDETCGQLPFDGFGGGTPNSVTLIACLRSAVVSAVQLSATTVTPSGKTYGPFDLTKRLAGLPTASLSHAW